MRGVRAQDDMSKKSGYNLPHVCKMSKTDNSMSKSDNFLENLKILSESICVKTNSISLCVQGELISTSHSSGHQVDGVPLAAIRNQC